MNPPSSENTIPNITDVIIIGAGVSGLNATRLVAQQHLSYQLLEANDYIGGRLKTEYIPIPNTDETLPFEWGAAWLHGVEGSMTVELFKELYAKHRPDVDFYSTINPIVDGCAWVLPEYLKYPYMLMFDPKSNELINKFEFNIFCLIVVYHLRYLLRLYPEIELSTFAQAYTNWCVDRIVQIASQKGVIIDRDDGGDAQKLNTILQQQLTEQTIGRLGRLIGCFFSWVESYNGVANGVMDGQCLFGAFDETQPEQLSKFDSININTKQHINSELYDLLSHVTYNTLPKKFEAIPAQDIMEILNHPVSVGYFSTLFSTLLLPLTNHDPVENDMDTTTMIGHYQHATPFFLHDDALTHGCYLGTHATLKYGYGQLIELLKKDTEMITATPLNIKLNTTVISITPPQKKNEANNNNDNDELNHFTKVITRNQITKEETTYYARRGVISSASLNAVKNFITLQNDQMVDKMNDVFSATEFVFYKKVAFLFTQMWWKYPEVKFFGTLQEEVDLITCLRCQHGHTDVDATEYVTYHNIDNTEKNNTQQIMKNQGDFSGPAYNCIINAAKNAIAANGGAPLPIRQQDGDLLPVVPCCAVNLTMESHLPFKHHPFVSCSLVGDLAEQLVGTDDVVVQEMVLNTYRKLYNSLWQNTPPEQRPEFKVAVARTTHWGETPTIAQSYSLIANFKSDSTERITALAEHNVFLCGESFNNYSTGGVQAGLESSAACVKHLVLGTNKTITDEEDKVLVAIAQKE